MFDNEKNCFAQVTSQATENVGRHLKIAAIRENCWLSRKSLREIWLRSPHFLWLDSIDSRTAVIIYALSHCEIGPVPNTIASRQKTNEQLSDIDFRVKISPYETHTTHLPNHDVIALNIFRIMNTISVCHNVAYLFRATAIGPIGTYSVLVVFQFDAKDAWEMWSFTAHYSV